MPLRSRRSVAAAGLIAGLTLVTFIAGSIPAALAQSAKPEYDPEVEQVARTIFFELLSPY
jgi:hypothetical protein